ncbi:FtsP/CotA-like multicopper oxidase with cupredoxin domain [Tumebacillus sp. BK434]|uniref:multicopper oxidase family protein n=1 Tax=Tumebacillus sp. BK434 TaxID=2512169 RepID=UPI001046C041|nr:multicopper oxidase family protein [Tumebacillus sp. BK434]TCP55517.1 FtsP/CotA-like multicopper oxidase with cupredoxin domain [Tumebacillus sp. BK434]
MNKMRKTVMLSLFSGLAVIAAAYGGYGLWNGQPSSEVLQGVEKQDEKGAFQEYVVEAREANWELKAGAEITAWTFNGAVPGSEIRVQEGKRVKVVLKNKLQQPVSIHWHGYPVPNAMDGIPGVTQNAVQPGASFTYEFTASEPGTYWYHSHQDSANQVDRGLYGALVVEPKEQKVKYDREFTLLLDEWSPEMFAASGAGTDHGGHGGGGSKGDDSGKQGSGSHAGTDHSAHSGDNGGASTPVISHDKMMKQMYSIFTVNGKAGSEVEPLQVKKGEKIKLRLINAGYQTHQLNLTNQTFKITHIDGQALQSSPDVSGSLLAIAPGERYDVELTAGANFGILCANDSQAKGDMAVHVEVDGNDSHDYAAPAVELSPLDITAYGKAAPVNINVNYDVETTLLLNNKVIQKDGAAQEVYTINGNIHPDIPPLQVKKGQQVKVTMTNEGTSDHPMHLHGHFFQVLQKDGRPLEGNPLLKDTLNVKPGETYVVAFVADNDGNWMFHCHDLHHAAAGMMTTVKYEGYQPSFVPDPKAGNKSE